MSSSSKRTPKAEARYNDDMQVAPVSANRESAKRFVRPEVLPQFSFTPRALALLAYVARDRLISSDDLALLDGGSIQNVKRELRRLWAHGYLMRPAAQLTTVALTGPRPLVYGLSNKGARALRDHGHAISAAIDWSENARRSGVVFLDHQVALARLNVAIELALRARSDIRLLRSHQVIAEAPEKTRLSSNPLKWCARISEKGREVPASLVSDDVFALQFSDGSAAYFVVEMDRGTMPVRRSLDKAEEYRGNQRRVRTYFKHKLQIYHAGWRQRRHVEQYGVEQIRVLTVTTSAKRVQTMLDAAREVTSGKGSDLFCFIDEQELLAGDPLEAKWVTGKGNTARLID